MKLINFNSSELLLLRNASHFDARVALQIAHRELYQYYHEYMKRFFEDKSVIIQLHAYIHYPKLFMTVAKQNYSYDLIRKISSIWFLGYSTKKRDNLITLAILEH